MKTREQIEFEKGRLAPGQKTGRVVSERFENNTHIVTAKYSGKKSAEWDRKNWEMDGYGIIAIEQLSMWKSWSLMWGFLEGRKVLVTYRKPVSE